MTPAPHPLERMARRGLRLALGAAKSAQTALKANPTVCSLLYDLGNAAEFSDISSHERMLADDVRMDTYARGIRRLVKPGDVVIDLGTGTGVLAILAAHQGATVYAIDHSPFIRVAEQVAHHNGAASIRFQQVHSKEFECPEKADVLLHEQMADCLFGENMIENLLDVKRRLLKETGRILPGRFELFVEPVALKQGTRIPFIWEMNVQGVDYGFLRTNAECRSQRKRASFFPYIDPSSVDFFLSTPEPILAFDLNQMHGPGELPTRFTAARTVTRPGAMAGLCVFFRASFDDDIALTTAPDQPRTHWGTRMFRTVPRECAANDTISYTVAMGSLQDASTWSAAVE